MESELDKERNEDMQDVRYGKNMDRVHRSEFPLTWRNCWREKGLGIWQWEKFLEINFIWPASSKYWSRMCCVYAFGFFFNVLFKKKLQALIWWCLKSVFRCFLCLLFRLSKKQIHTTSHYIPIRKAKIV